MPTPYQLLLISNDKADTPEGIFTCGQMLAWGLWREFSKLPHVTLTYQNAEVPLGVQPQVDFTLLHSYFASPIFNELPALRTLTRKHIINFMEIPHADVDYNFTYLPTGNEQVLFPCVSELLNRNPMGEKWSNSVLLDHSWRDGEVWNDRLYEWLEPLKDSCVIGQLRRPEHEKLAPPEWVQSIPQLCYLEYLKQTAPYENFVLTHPGTYEHSIIDMMYRGIRVLIPMQDGDTFVDPNTVNTLGLPTFSSRDELLAHLKNPQDGDWRMALCTDMPEIVRRIDAYCQKVLNA